MKQDIKCSKSYKKQDTKYQKTTIIILIILKLDHHHKLGWNYMNQ